MRNTFTILACALFLFASCGSGNDDHGPRDTAHTQTPPSPFAELATRYDGIYRSENGGVVYMLRLFPEGRAVLINGLPQGESELPAMLTRDAEGDPSKGWYNVAVDVEGDSLFFVTTPRRGEISYRGIVTPEGDLSLLRHSHITGKRQVMLYRYLPDGSY